MLVALYVLAAAAAVVAVAATRAPQAAPIRVRVRRGLRVVRRD
jgi:hypothetical protein